MANDKRTNLDKREGGRGGFDGNHNHREGIFTTKDRAMLQIGSNFCQIVANVTMFKFVSKYITIGMATILWRHVTDSLKITCMEE